MRGFLTVLRMLWKKNMYNPPTDNFGLIHKDSYDEGYEAAKTCETGWMDCPYNSTGYDFKVDAEHYWYKGFNDCKRED